MSAMTPADAPPTGGRPSHRPRVRQRDPVGESRGADADLPGTDPRDRPTRQGDGLDPTRFGDWEKNGRCIDF